ncbi:hypothetical protein BJ875DRAFT_372194, partial [Amylocarpus encephaloides]
SELKHIHIFRTTPSNLSITIASLEGYMLHGPHHSKSREWIGTFIIGGSNPRGSKAVGENGLLVTGGWRGWMSGEREELVRFGMGVSVEEAWGERGVRMDLLRARGWRGVCEEGIWEFK